MSGTMSDSSVADMSETQFKASLDALIAGELDDSGETPGPGSSSASSLASGNDSHQQQQQRHHQSTFSEILHLQGNRRLSQTNMNLVNNSIFPNLIPSHFPGCDAQQDAANFVVPLGPQSSSLFTSALPLSSYASSISDSFYDSKYSSGSSRNSKRRSEFEGAAVSEDESSRLKRKEERNAREQKRSQQIVDQIGHLRELLKRSNIQTKPDKYSTLVTATKYIRELQERSASLENEQKKLLMTIGQATDLAQNKYIPVTSSSETDNDVLDRNSSSKHDVSVSDGDEQPFFVSGLDYRAIFLACPVAGAITSIDGRFLECNDDFEVLTGYSKDELFRKPTDPLSFEPAERHHLSVFNVLKREDMERLFVVMSRMLRTPALDLADKARQRECDRWNDRVTLNRKDNRQVNLSIKLIRRKNGLPKFFSCSLIPVP